MAYLEIRGTGTDAKEPLEIAQRYLQDISYQTQGAALAAGLRAYLAVMRRAAQAAAPYEAFRKSKGYRWNVRIVSRGLVSGYLYSKGYGNILEAGADGHYAPIEDTVQDNGEVWAGLGRWMRQHAPDLLARWGKSARYAKVPTRMGRPWVIPASQGAEAQAVDAFTEALVDAIAKEVM